MAIVNLTADQTRDATGTPDNGRWYVWAAEYQEGGSGIITSRRSDPIRPVAGVLTIPVEAGITAIIEGPNSRLYPVTTPMVDTPLWNVIEAAIAFPPETSAELLASVVSQYLDDNPPAADWDALDNKPAVVAAGSTQANARASINAEVAGATKTTEQISDAGAAGKNVVKAATVAAVRAASNSAPFLAPGRYTAASKANGTPTQMDTTQAVTLFGNTPSSVVSGYLKHTPVGNSQSTASYFQVPTGTKPTRIIVRGRWTGSDGNDNASLTIVVPISAWGPAGGFPADNAAQVVAGVHSSFYRKGIHKHSRWNVGTQTVYGDSDAAAGSNPALGRYSTVPVNKVVKIEIWIDYDLGTITFLPPQGGKPVVIQDDTIKTDCGPWVIAEQFEYLGTTAGSPFEILDVDFDVQARDVSAFHLTAPDVAELVPGLIAAAAEGLESTVASGGTKVLTADSPRVQAFTTGTPSSTNHTVKLPLSVYSLQPMYIYNAMAGGQLTVQDSAGTTMVVLTTGQRLDLMPQTLSPTVVGNWFYVPVVSAIGTQTLSSTRVNPRVTSTATATSITPSFATADVYKYTGLATAATIGAPANTTDGHRLTFMLKDDGTSRALTWNAAYVAMSGVTLPTATTAGKWLIVEYRYNSTSSQAFVTYVGVQP